MNIYEKIDIVCERIEELHESLMNAHELCNEPGISYEIQYARYLELERLNKVIEALKQVKEGLFIEAGISID